MARVTLCDTVGCGFFRPLSLFAGQSRTAGRYCGCRAEMGSASKRRRNTMNETTNYYAACFNVGHGPIAVYGVHATPDGALDDARQWADDLTSISVYPCTDAVYAQVTEHGNDTGAYTLDDDDVLALVTEVQS